MRSLSLCKAVGEVVVVCVHVKGPVSAVAGGGARLGACRSAAKSANTARSGRRVLCAREEQDWGEGSRASALAGERAGGFEG